ncbi:MAG: hypothetical protein LJE85_05570 [Gammaproteobacteria bacterium]|jgi:hypothetical protein|nr:hypothetical protein [Gammaproteobacteria bacterium]
MNNFETGNDKLITNTSIKEYFHDTVSEAIANQQINASEETAFYLVNLLTAFSRSEQLFERGENGVDLKPLALIYADALSQPNVIERSRLLQKLGDTALFIAGVFADSLNRKLVDVDYYIAMGGSAYSTVSEMLRGAYHNDTAKLLFDELTEKFTAFVDVLNEVSEKSNLCTNADVLRLYEIWIRTGSKRAEGQLRRLGIQPLDASQPDFQH